MRFIERNSEEIKLTNIFNCRMMFSESLSYFIILFIGAVKRLVFIIFLARMKIVVRWNIYDRGS